MFLKVITILISMCQCIFFLELQKQMINVIFFYFLFLPEATKGARALSLSSAWLRRGRVRNTGLVTRSLPSEFYKKKQRGPLQRIYIGNNFDQTSPRGDSSLLFCLLLDFTLFYVKGFWTVGFQEFGGHLIREHSNDLAVQLPLGSRRQRQLGKDKSVCARVWTWWMSARCGGKPIKEELN